MMRLLEEILAAIGLILTMSGTFIVMDACREHFSKLPHSQWPRLERHHH